MFRYLRLLNFLLLAGCGYHFQETAQKTTLSIPYVKGDNEGQLTSELIRQFSASGAYEVVRTGGSLLLKVDIMGDNQEKIGFRYDREEFSGKIKKNLMATENRRLIRAEVSLIEEASNEVVSGPFQVTAFADFDYTDVNSIYDLAFIGPHDKRTTVLNFSLGQVDSIEGAQDDAIVAVYRQLAQKVVSALVNRPLSKLNVQAR